MVGRAPKYNSENLEHPPLDKILNTALIMLNSKVTFFCKEIIFFFFRNMVGTISVGCPLDLNQINSRVRYSEYNPGKFHGLIMKILNPRTTCLAFQSGKLLILGAKHEHDCKLASRKFAKILKQLGHPVSLFSPFPIKRITIFLLLC
jgi:TATA-box binding protein (TBP), component of TFIID and TFIIIB